MPDGSYGGFGTLRREQSFRNPTKKGHSVPILNELVAPHIESFNALFDDSGLPSGDGVGTGLLSLAIRDIGEKVVFDYTGREDEHGNRGLGNRMSCMSHSFDDSECGSHIASSLDRAGIYCEAYGPRQG